MWVELPPLAIVLLNLVAIPVIHLAVSWLFLQFPSSWFVPTGWLYRERGWERAGKTYEDVFKIRSWKPLLPDAAPWFKGFAKGKLASRDPEYVRTFILETCRGEIAHYAQIPALLVTWIWNPWPGACLVLLVYALLSNLPCILLQRFTRVRLARVLP
jgi:glycosyl-4,4'-diaponeurosporenoate acyltransferase